MLDLISPKTDLNSFDLVSYNNPYNISLIISSILPIRSLLFDLINNSDDVNILVLNKICLMIPMKVSMSILSCDLLICNLMNFILLVLKSNLRRSKFSFEKLNALDIVALAFFKIFLFLEGYPTSNINPNHLFVTINKSQK